MHRSRWAVLSALVSAASLVALSFTFGVWAKDSEATKASQSKAKAGAAARLDVPPLPVRAPRPGTEAKTKTAALAAPIAPVIPAKVIFGRAKAAAPLEARAIGFYSRGCLAGARQLAVDGPAWQVMRLSRNRNWGHPKLVALIERLAREAKANDGWPGLMVGDMAQPRGGPMLTGHASHQVGLDADIWLTKMPDRRLSRTERENLSATSMLGDTPLTVGKAWTPEHVKLVKRAASYGDVERIFVHPAIKKALCEAAGTDRGWLGKVRPYWGHYYHMHIRMKCPPGSPSCRAQRPPDGNDGCDKELASWLKRVTPKPPPVIALPKLPAKPWKPSRPVTLADMPEECRVVAEAPAKQIGPVGPHAAKVSATR